MIIEEKVQEILLAKSFTETSGKGRTNEKVLITDKDFSAFSKKVADTTGTDEKNINTWKRVFGRLKTPDGKPCNISEDTCQIIAEYLNCDSWNELMDNLDDIYTLWIKRGGINNVSCIAKNSIDILLSTLKKGDVIKVCYYPQRVLHLEFIQKSRYKVVFSKNTLMEYGDIITINMLKTNYPLMVTDIIRNDISKGTYTSANGHNIQSVEILSRKGKYDF